MDHSNGHIDVNLRDRSLTVVTSMEGANYQDFWALFSQGLWEADTLQMIEGLSDPDMIFLDIGGWVGPTALWAAFNQKRVITFEPDPIALKALRANLALNPELANRITVMPVATGTSDMDLDLFSAQPGLSETSVFSTVHRVGGATTFNNRHTVPCVDIAAFIRRLAPNENKIFIKMDIEGAEFQILPHIAALLKSYDIRLSVSFHNTNIVERDADSTMAARLLRLAKCLEPFIDLNWYAFGAGRYTALRKFEHLVNIFNNLGINSDLVISREFLIQD